MQDSDSAFAALRQAQQDANNLTMPSQWDIGWGDYWFSTQRLSGKTIWVFGRVATREEYSEELARGYSPSEVDDILSYQAMHDQGYRWGTSYSVAYPAGEVGDTHISTMWGTLTPPEFQLCQTCAWDIDAIAAHGLDLKSRALDMVAKLALADEFNLQ